MLIISQNKWETKRKRWSRAFDRHAKLLISSIKQSTVATLDLTDAIIRVSLAAAGIQISWR